MFSVICAEAFPNFPAPVEHILPGYAQYAARICLISWQHIAKTSGEDSQLLGTNLPKDTEYFRENSVPDGLQPLRRSESRRNQRLSGSVSLKTFPDTTNTNGMYPVDCPDRVAPWSCYTRLVPPGAVAAAALELLEEMNHPVR